MAKDPHTVAQGRRAMEVMTALVEDDSFALFRQVLQAQFEEGGDQALIDLSIGLAQMCQAFLAKLEYHDVMTVSDSLQSYAEIFTAPDA